MAKDTIASFYKFTSIKNPKELRKIATKKAQDLELKGTLLLAEEGLNGMISGAAENIEAFRVFLGSQKDVGELKFKLSYYDDVSFRRLLVKVKKEIITIRQDLDPTVETGHYLDPLEFEKWYEEGRDMVVLDTRNDYEVAMGTFEGAIDPNIKSFEAFTTYIDEHLAELQGKPIVTFCTGGVRCEKATAYMLKKGMKDVYQLEGGIISYFEAMKQLAKEGHWKGECTVFDKRKAITKDLEPSSKQICYVCLHEMKGEEVAEKEGPGGEICKSCDAKTKASQGVRQERGKLKAQANQLSRKAHLKG
jgi:UPF0176 protein